MGQALPSPGPIPAWDPLFSICADVHAEVIGSGGHAPCVVSYLLRCQGSGSPPEHAYPTVFTFKRLPS